MGVCYYRLKQVDFDGTFEYLKVVTVDLGLPETFILKQNYPNPFNPKTVINYQVPKNGIITLKVYDVLGNEIATLVDEVQTAGSYSVDFDASDLPAGRQGLISGIYFYKLTAEDFSSVRKMILLK
jgi:hypothetical protein